MNPPFNKKFILELFETIKKNSYPELSKCNLYFKQMSITAYSSPFTNCIYINLELINQEKLTTTELVAILAHELSHQISYQKRNFISKWLFLSGYFIFTNSREKVENEADIITIERGYEKELIFEREHQMKRYKKRFKNNPKMINLVSKIYYSSDEIKNIMEKISR